MRKIIAEKESVLTSHPESPERTKEREAIISQEIKDYTEEDASKVLHESFQLQEKEKV